jgi:formiminoglutamase
VNAREWLSSSTGARADIAVVGAPIARASISPSRAWSTPPAFREALARFSTFDLDHGVDLTSLACVDLGDVESDEHEDDASAAHSRIEEAVKRARARAGIVMVIGGDNSLTRPALSSLADGELGDGWGLLTLDAHHDVRDPRQHGGSRNGTPVRELIDAGLPGARVAQIGLHGFANAWEHSQWAEAAGIHVRRATEVRAGGIARVVDSALTALDRAGARRLFVDIDLDVLDRAFAPACPASMPGGLAPWHLQEAAFLLGRDPRVEGVDLVEVDAEADLCGITVRNMASVFLAFSAGCAERLRQARGHPQ